MMKLSNVVPIAACALLMVGPAASAVLPIDGVVTVVNAPLGTLAVGDRVVGTVTADLGQAAAAGRSDLVLDEASDLQLVVAGITFDASADASFGAGFPTLVLQDGTPTGLDFFVSSVQAFAFTEAVGFQVFADGVFEFFDANSDLTLAAGELSIVPLPGGLVLLASALGGLAVLRRRGGTA